MDVNMSELAYAQVTTNNGCGNVAIYNINYAGEISLGDELVFDFNNVMQQGKMNQVAGLYISVRYSSIEGPSFIILENGSSHSVNLESNTYNSIPLPSSAPSKIIIRPSVLPEEGWQGFEASLTFTDFEVVPFCFVLPTGPS